MEILIPIFGLLLSCTFLWTSLWQIEICTVRVAEGSDFDFPFFIGGKINKWAARDFWYTANVIGWVLAVISGYVLAVSV